MSHTTQGVALASKAAAEALVDETTGAASGEGATGAASRGRSSAKKTAAKKSTSPARARGKKAVDLLVLEQEDPWTAKELSEVQSELATERERLATELEQAEAELAELMRDSGDGSGDDQADAGSATWEREHELSLTINAKELLEQIEHALERIEEGTYGTCESCGNAVGKMRLQAFPRATLCLSCKQKQERR